MNKLDDDENEDVECCKVFEDEQYMGEYNWLSCAHATDSEATDFGFVCACAFFIPREQMSIWWYINKHRIA